MTDPEAVLREAIRVTKPGGAIYLLFGPLYWSSYGLHASLSITVPFCHVLFDRPALESYVAERDLEPIPFATLNGWRVGQFRDLWRRHAASLKPEVYREIPSLPGSNSWPSVRRASAARPTTSTTSSWPTSKSVSDGFRERRQPARGG